MIKNKIRKTAAWLAAVCMTLSLPVFAESAYAEAAAEETTKEDLSTGKFDNMWDAYRDQMKTLIDDYGNGSDNNGMTFGFAYIDDDTTPELVAQFPGGGIEIYTMRYTSRYTMYGTNDNYYEYDDNGNLTSYEVYTSMYEYETNNILLSYQYGDSSTGDYWWEIATYSFDFTDKVNELILDAYYDFENECWIYEDQSYTEDEINGIFGSNWLAFDCPYDYDEASDVLLDLWEQKNEADMNSLKSLQSKDTVYQNAYDEEYANIDDYITLYCQTLAENQDEDNATSDGTLDNETILEIADTLEEAYQTVDDVVDAIDPNLEDVVSSDAALRFGDSLLGCYLIKKGVSAALSDSTLGTAIREGAVITIFSLWNAYMDSLPDVSYTAVDSLWPADIGEDYILVRTYGTVGQILDQAHDEILYPINAIYARIRALREANGENRDSYAVADVENCAKIDALTDRADEYQAAYDELENDLKAAFGDENGDYPTGDYIYCVIDPEGNVYAAVLAPLANGGSVDREGNFYLSAGGRDVIFDKNANIIFESQDKNEGINFSPLSENGHCLGVSYHDDFDYGEYDQVDFYSMDGSHETILRVEKDSISGGSVTDDGDYMTLPCCPLNEGHQTVYIDMSNGDIISEEEYKERTAVADPVFPEGFSVNSCEWLNDECFFCSSDNKVYDANGNELADLSGGGGVADIHMTLDGVCWVVSNTHYYYTLNGNWERIFEPKEFEDGESYVLTDYGMFMEETKTYCAQINNAVCTHLLDKNGKIEEEFNGADTSCFHGCIFGSQYSGWMNLSTKEWLVFSEIPEAVSTLEISY